VIQPVHDIEQTLALIHAWTTGRSQEHWKRLPLTIPLKAGVSQGQRDSHQEPEWHHHHHAHPQSKQKQILQM
jgi:hypothetical protein